MAQSHRLQQSTAWLRALWKFSRPHTIIGTSFSVVGLYLIALDRLTVLPALGYLLATLAACLCGNLYIVGLNQLEDVAIDQINKPHLPLASGELSRPEGVAIVATTGCLALVLSALQGPFLFATVGLSLAIGTAYSLPPVRLKRFPFWAALCIFGVRGVIVNLGVFLHFSDRLRGTSQISPEVWALTGFILAFTFAIAVFKDIPDITGDRHYNIATLTIRFGPQAVFNLARWVITACYLGMATVGVFWLPSAHPLVIGLTHILALGLLWWRSLQVDLKQKSAIASFYQFIWKLFFWEYLIFPAACLVG